MGGESKSLQEDLWPLLDIQNELEEIQGNSSCTTQGVSCGTADCLSGYYNWCRGGYQVTWPTECFETNQMSKLQTLLN